MKNEGSEDFQACRRLVHDDAFEAKIARHMVLPLLQGALRELKTKYLYDSVLFFRRSIARYLALALCRLLARPEKGKTGITASIASLLEMAEADKLLSKDKVEQLRGEFEKIKAGAGEGGEWVKSLYDLRTGQVAHSLIRWDEPKDQVMADHLIEFADAIFEFVVKLESALFEATGIVLADLEKSAGAFEDNAGQFWRAQTTLKFLADGEPPGGKLAT